MTEMDAKSRELAEKRQKIEAGGGEKRVQRQHKSGKLTARERIHALLDEDTFVELDAFAEHRCVTLGMDQVEAPGEGVVTGYGTIDGKLVYVFSQDFTVIGGSLGEMHAAKICKVMDMAVKMGATIIGIKDSGGARIQEGVDALKGYGDIFFRNSRASGVVPQISLILGPCAGGAVYSPALTDFVFTVDGTSNMFITGPQVIKAVTGEDVSPETLGGAMTHNQKSGCAHFIADKEEECFAQVRQLLSFIPSNNLEEPAAIEAQDDPNRISTGLSDMVPTNPNKGYDIRDVVREVLDGGEFFEVQPHYAPNLVIGYGRLNGRVVAVVGNQPKILAGCLDINASDKAARFIRFCDAFNIPLVTFADVPGYLPGVEQEYGGIIRHGAKLLYAYSEATVPKLTVILRKAYGGAYVAMCSRHLGADMVMAWPTAEIAVMGPQGAANIIFRKEIKEAEDPQAMLDGKIEEYKERFANPYSAAGRGYIDDVIEPAVTRPRLISALEMALSKRDVLPAKKHGNIPV